MSSFFATPSGETKTRDTSSIASSIHDTNFYMTAIQNKADMQTDMVLTEVSLLRLLTGIYLKDQGNSEKIETEVVRQLDLEN